MSVYVAGVGEIVVVQRWVGEGDATAFALATVKGCRGDKVVLEGAGREVFLCDPASIWDGSELEAGEEEEESKVGEDADDAEEGGEESALYETWTEEMVQGAETPVVDQVGDAAVTQMCNTYVETRDVDCALAVLGQEQQEDQERIVSRLLRAINSSSMAGPAHVQHRVVALFLLAKILAKRKSDPETTSQLLQYLRDHLLSLPSIPTGIATELVTGSLSL